MIPVACDSPTIAAYGTFTSAVFTAHRWAMAELMKCAQASDFMTAFKRWNTESAQLTGPHYVWSQGTS
jgi:hypothetical protein